MYKKLLAALEAQYERYCNVWEQFAESDDWDGIEAAIRSLRDGCEAISEASGKLGEYPVDIPTTFKIRSVSQRILELDGKLSSKVGGQFLQTEVGELELFQTPAGCDEVIDTRLIPSDWDWAKDIVCMGGRVPVLLTERLIARGQKRIIILDSTDSVYPEPVIKVSTVDQGRKAITEFADPHPAQMANMAVNRTGDDLANYDRFADMCHHHIQHVVSTIKTMDELGPVWVPQGIRNLAMLPECAPVSNLLGKLDGVPMVMAAPGPSLPQSYEALRRAQGRFLIVSFSQSLRALQSNGIDPDLVILVDPSDLGYHFEGCDLSKVGGLVLGATCHPDMYKLPIKNKFYYSGNAGLEGWLVDCFGAQCTLPAAGTVAHTTYSFALYLRSNPVVLVGMDLAFQTDRAYAAGGVDDSATVEYAADGTMRMVGHKFDGMPMHVFDVAGYYGGNVRTSAIYNQFRKWFEEQFAAANTKGVRVINATCGGAYIKNAEHLSLDQVLEYYAESAVDIRGQINNAARVDLAQRRAQASSQATFLLRALDAAAELVEPVRQACLDFVAGKITKPEFKAIEANFMRQLEPVGFTSLIKHAQVRALKPSPDGDTAAQTLEVASRFKEIVDEIRPVLARVESKLRKPELAPECHAAPA